MAALDFIWSSGYQAIYADGMLCDQWNVTGTVTYNNVPFMMIGAEPNNTISPEQFFTGNLDEIKFYNRVLDNASIFDLYFEPTRNLYAYYPLSFNSANDLSGNFRNGNIPNTANLNSDGGRDNRTDHGLFFNGGSNDFVSLPNGFDNFTNGLTITGWSFPTDLTLSSQRNWARIVDFGNGASSSNIIFAKWQTHQGSLSQLSDGWINKDDLEQLDYFSSGRWNFEALTQVGGNSGIPTRTRLFRNDRRPLKAMSCTFRSKQNSNYIESNWTSDSPQGSHDDIRIYQRTLQDEEVYAIYPRLIPCPQSRKPRSYKCQ